MARTNPFYVSVGAGDLAVEKLRELSARIAGLRPTAPKVEPKAVQAGVSARLGQLQAQALELPAKAQSVTAELGAKAEEAYGDLAARGKGLVERIRTQQATKDLVEQAKRTVSRTKAAGTTAKKSASRTRTAAKAAATSANETASAAVEAAEAAVDQVG